METTESIPSNPKPDLAQLAERGLGDVGLLLRQFDSRLTDLSNKVESTASGNELADLRDEVESIQNDINNLDIDALERAAGNASTVDDLEEQASNHESRLDDIDSEIEYLKENVSNHESRLDDIDSEIGYLKDAKYDADSLREALDLPDFDKLEERMRMIEGTVDVKTYDRVTDAVACLRADLDDLKSKYAQQAFTSDEIRSLKAVARLIGALAAPPPVQPQA